MVYFRCTCFVVLVILICCKTLKRRGYQNSPLSTMALLLGQLGTSASEKYENIIRFYGGKPLNILFGYKNKLHIQWSLFTQLHMNSSFPYLSLFAPTTASIQKSAHFYTYTTSARSTQSPKRSYGDEILIVSEQPLFLFLSTVTNSRKRFFELVYTFSLTLASSQANPVSLVKKLM